MKKKKYFDFQRLVNLDERKGRLGGLRRYFRLGWLGLGYLIIGLLRYWAGRGGGLFWLGGLARNGRRRGGLD